MQVQFPRRSLVRTNNQLLSEVLSIAASYDPLPDQSRLQWAKEKKGTEETILIVDRCPQVSPTRKFGLESLAVFPL